MRDAMRAETVTITGGGGDAVEAYLAQPTDRSSVGGVVVIHHMPGFDAATKEITRKFAAHGYLAVCPNLYFLKHPAPARTMPLPRPAPRVGCPILGWSGTWPGRPTGMVGLVRAESSGRSKTEPVISVCVQPGATQLA